MREINNKISKIIDSIQSLPFALDSVENEKNTNLILESLKVDLRN